MNPVEQSPLRVRNFKEASWLQQKERGNCEQCGDSLPFSDFAFGIWNLELWPILPAKPKKVDCKKWHEPAEVVLLIDGPFATQLSAKHKPQSDQKQNAQHKWRREMLFRHRRSVSSFLWSCQILHDRQVTESARKANSEYVTVTNSHISLLPLGAR